MNNILDPEFVAESQPTLWTTEPKKKKKKENLFELQERTCSMY